MINQNGEFLELLNLDKLLSATQLMIEKISLEGLPEEKKSQARMLLSRFADPAILQNQLQEKFQLMHRFYGMQYAQDSVWRFDEEIPVPLDTTKVIHCRNSVIVTLPENWNGLARLENYVSIDEGNMMMLMESLFKGTNVIEKLADLYKKHPPHAQKFSSYIIEPETGIIYGMYHEVETFHGERLISREFIDIDGKWW
jgi:hypothetical protein